MAKESGRVGPSIFFLGLPFSRILGSYVFLFPNIGPHKILGHLDVVWSLKVKNMEKGFSGSAGLIPNKWGNCELSPKIIIKHKYNPYMMQISWNIK